MTYKEAWFVFKAHAAKRGFREKVIGDDAFQKGRSPGSPTMRLISAKGEKITVYEEGRGRYVIEERTSAMHKLIERLETLADSRKVQQR